MWSGQSRVRRRLLGNSGTEGRVREEEPVVSRYLSLLEEMMSVGSKITLDGSGRVLAGKNEVFTERETGNSLKFRIRG